MLKIRPNHWLRSVEKGYFPGFYGQPVNWELDGLRVYNTKIKINYFKKVYEW